MVSCVQKEAFQEEVKTIELKESKDFLPISSFVSELDYLELQVTEANIEIGEIQDIKIFGTDLIIKQRKAGEISFIRFSKDGKFLNEIINNTNGQVAIPRDIIEYQKDYAILGEKGIHVVSRKGVYKGQLIAAEMSGGNFFEIKNRFYTINETQSGQFLDVYSKNEKAECITRLTKRLNKLVYTSCKLVGKADYHLISSFSDTIYKFANNKLTPLYRLDGGTYPTLNEVWQNVVNLDPRETMRYIYDRQHTLVKNYLENDEIIFMTYWVGSSSTTVIIKKDNWETRYYARGVNDIDGGIWQKALHLSVKNELYIPISANKVAGHKISNKWHKDFEHLQIHIAATGNPVIMRCTLE